MPRLRSTLTCIIRMRPCAPPMSPPVSGVKETPVGIGPCYNAEGVTLCFGDNPSTLFAVNGADLIAAIKRAMGDTP